MGGWTGASGGEVYASSEVGCEQERAGVGFEIRTYEMDSERVLGAIRLLDEDDGILLDNFGESGIEGSLRSLGKSSFKYLLPRRALRCR